MGWRDLLKYFLGVSGRRLARKTRLFFFASLNFTGKTIFALGRFLRKCGDKNAAVTGSYALPGLQGIRRILLFRNDRIGDMVLTLPAIVALREVFPDAKIAVAVSQANEALLEYESSVDLTIRLEKYGSLIAQIAGLKTFSPDLTISFIPSFRNNLLAFLCGARYRIGFDACGSGFFLTASIPDDREYNVRHESLIPFELIRLAGIKARPSCPRIKTGKLWLEAALKEISRLQIEPANTVLIHPGARQPYIRWLPEKFAAVHDLLVKKGYTVLVLEGPGERDIIENMRKFTGECMRTVSFKSLGTLIGFMSMISGFIGNSTGTMHLAHAAGTVTVAIFSNKHPLDSREAWGPPAPYSAALFEDPGCLYCHPGDCSHFKCKTLLSPETVVATLEKLVAEKKGSESSASDAGTRDELDIRG